jgi:hypothetical protein
MVPCGDAEALVETAPRRQCATMTHDADQGPDHHDDDGGGGRRAALIGLVVCAVLVVAAYYLVNSLRDEGNREDCLMSGRTNCAPLDIPTHK